MTAFRCIQLVVASLFLALETTVSAQNPIIQNQFTADPSARVFNGKVYLYPSHDLPPEKEEVHNLVVVLNDHNPVEIDWVRFY
jgi:hypothetical protein